MIWLAELGQTFLQKNCSNHEISIENLIESSFMLGITILSFLSQKKQIMCNFATVGSFYKLNRMKDFSISIMGK